MRGFTLITYFETQLHLGKGSASLLLFLIRGVVRVSQ